MENYIQKEHDELKRAARLIVNHYKTNEYFRNSFLVSVESALKELPRESNVEDVAKAVADRIMGIS